MPFFTHKVGEQRSVVAGSCTNLQNFLARLEVKLLENIRDYARLRG